MPKPPKRPRDANQLARMIVDLATGDKAEDKPEPPTAAQEAGQIGGQIRAQRLTPSERKLSAKRAAEARWKKAKERIKESS